MAINRSRYTVHHKILILSQQQNEAFVVQVRLESPTHAVVNCSNLCVSILASRYREGVATG